MSIKQTTSTACGVYNITTLLTRFTATECPCSQIEYKKQYMPLETQIQFFENAKIRVVWDEEKEEYFFSIVDVISVLTVSADAAAYWRKLKQRLKAEGNETVTSCHTLKMSATNLRLMRLFYEAWSDLFNSSAKADELRGNNSPPRRQK